jgi:hypothetical protein
MLRRFRYDRARFVIAATVASMSASAGALEATAQAQPLLERFDPAERGSRFFVADSLELDAQLRFTTGAVFSYASRPRTFRQTGADAEASRLVEHSFWLHPGASLVMAPGARFALDIPIAMQSGADVTLDRTTAFAPTSPAFGDVKASFDLRLAGRERSDVDGAVLAAGVSAYVPTGASSAYASDDFARFAFRLATSVQSGPVLAAARVGYMYRKDDLDSFAGVRLGSEANAVLAAGYHRGALVIGPELHGSTILKSAFERRSTPIEVLGGLHANLGDVRVGAGLGGAIVAGLGAARFRGVLSIEWTPVADVPRDRDHDGVMDADDMCPDVPGLASAPIGGRGCPAPPLDDDGDGIVDGEDACPQVKGIRTKDPMTHGCPDADHDGIPDPLDACPNVSGERSVLPRYNGCPPDADGDGVPDLDDACPDDSGAPNDDATKNGCAPPRAASNDPHLLPGGSTLAPQNPDKTRVGHVVWSVLVGDRRSLLGEASPHVHRPPSQLQGAPLHGQRESARAGASRECAGAGATEGTTASPALARGSESARERARPSAEAAALG